MPAYTPQDILTAEFDSTLSRYPDHVKEDLQELDEYRFETLPRTVTERWQKQASPDGNGSDIILVSKDELVELVTWKLKHGTFRPKFSLSFSNMH